jgi:hypothetical protein
MLIFHVVTSNTNAQNKLINPLDGKLLLSANYGELRSMHFHSGIDLKVGGTPGAKVFAVADAYVYRLSVSPQGYGNCVYLKHYDGNITVYGHLHKFNAIIANFIKTEQYKRKSFAIDTVFAEPVFKVKSGEIIGIAGNSGSSFGAHLHFEIRNSANTPINPIPKFYDIHDNISPTIKSLTVFTLDSFANMRLQRIVQDIPLKNVKGRHDIQQTIEIESPAFFGIEAFDNVSETYNKIGIRKISVMLDNSTVFSCRLDSLEFEKNRYINSLQAFNLLTNENRNVIKTYVEQGNNLNKYQNVINSGIIEINDSLMHKISITLEDDYENKSILSFNIKAKKSGKSNLPNYHKTNCIEWKSGGLILSEGAGLLVPPKTFYDDVYVEFEKSDTAANDFSSEYCVNTHSVAAHKPFNIVMKANVVHNLRNKIMLAGVRNGKSFAVDAEYFMGFVNAKISLSGCYLVVIDTISPLVTPKFNDGADLQKQRSLNIKITDNLSGIQKYEGYIDGEWALFEYDAKNSLLSYTFDSNRIARNKKHSLKLIVSDNKNNITVFESSFVW